MKQKIIGSYYFGPDQVQLVLREGDGGEFYLFPENGKIASIKVGVDYEEFRDFLEVILHESYEYCMTKYECRLKGTNVQTQDHCQYTFLFTHSQFSEITARCAEFISSSLPDIKKEWKKWHKKVKK